LKPAADAKKIIVRQTIENELGGIIGDVARIQQIIWNLISNAIKFTPSGGSVEIKLKAETEHLVISVSDTGDGIDPQFLPFVFDRFLQADGSTTRTHGGLGLGLAIVRHLVELHGGTVKAESDGKGKGAVFTVRLPLGQRPKVETQTNRKAPAVQQNSLKNDSCNDLSGLTVLVVDDEIDSLELIKVFLEHCGAQVETANSVEKALNYLTETLPDVLVSDIGMPDADGYELIRRVREFAPERGGSIPAVALTAYARSEDKTRALHSGFQTHLAKPIEMDELITAISKVSGRN
jgi:CheY-like chemotaxis protein